MDPNGKLSMGFSIEGNTAKALYIMHKVMGEQEIYFTLCHHNLSCIHFPSFKSKKKKIKAKKCSLTDAFLNQNIYHRNKQRTSP